jgi:hypothetical protein
VGLCFTNKHITNKSAAKCPLLAHFAADADVMRIKRRFIFASLALVFSNACFADGTIRPINISECMIKNCMARGIHKFSPEDSFMVQAWFDIVRREDTQTTYFFPLFNVFNYTQIESEVLVGMQLLDQNKKILLEVKDKRLVSPTQETEGSVETYISLNANQVTVEIVKNTRFLNVIFRR